MTTTRLDADRDTEQDPPLSWRAGPLTEIAIDRQTAYGHRLTVWGRRRDDRASLNLTVTERGPRVMLAEVFHAGGVVSCFHWLDAAEEVGLGVHDRALLEAWVRAGIAAWHAEDAS